MSVSAPDDAFLDVNDAHLRVYGNVHADGLKLGQLEVVTTTSTGSTIQFLHQHTAFTTTSNIDVGTTNHELFVDTNLSRVGILTNTPTTALDVNGTVTATAFAGDGANLTGIPSSAINGTLSQWTTVTGPKIHYSDGNVGVGVADPAFKLDVDGDINFTGTLREDGNPFVSTPWTIESGPTALSYTGGNVGIGAGTPSAKLEVTGNAHVSTDLSVGGTLSINTITAAATHALSAVTAVGASTGDTIQLTHATTGLVTTANVEVGKDLTVAGDVTVDTNTLHVDATNNRVGVGTVSPNYKLHVVDSDSYSVAGRIESKTGTTAGTSTSAYMDVVDGAGNGGYIQGIHDPFVTHGLRLGTWTGGGRDSAKMCILSNGRVGIGTAIPAAPLEVVEGTSGAPLTAETTVMQLNSRVGGSTSDHTSYFKFKHIPETNPVDWADWSGRLQFVTDTTNQGYMEFNPPGSEYGIAFGNTGGGSAAGEIMRLLGTGQVGIGYTNPSERLEVDGNIRANNLNLDGTQLVNNVQLSCTAGTWVKLTDTSALNSGMYLFQVCWDNAYDSTTRIWSGCTSFDLYVRAGSTGIFNPTPFTTISHNPVYHYRTISGFSFGHQSDSSGSNYGYQSIYIQSPQSTITVPGLSVVAYKIS